MVILKFKSYCRERVLPEIHDNKEVPVELYGQFHVQLGQLDRVYTIWRHSGGYSDVDKTLLQLNNMTSYQKFVEDQGKLVRKREQQLCYEFAFWPTYDDYYDGGLFEIRSYTLKVVTIVYCVSGSSVLWMSSFIYRHPKITSHQICIAPFFYCNPFCWLYSCICFCLMFKQIFSGRVSIWVGSCLVRVQ